MQYEHALPRRRQVAVFLPDRRSRRSLRSFAPSRKARLFASSSVHCFGARRAQQISSSRSTPAQLATGMIFPRRQLSWPHSQCQRSPLTSMDQTASRAPLGLELTACDDGWHPTQAPPQAQHQLTFAQVEEGTGTLDANGQQWVKRCFNNVQADAREGPRHKPSLNSGGKQRGSFEELYVLLFVATLVGSRYHEINNLSPRRSRRAEY